MRIGIDVMGGDHAPGVILDGACAALDRLDPTDELVLVGDGSVIESGLSDRGIGDERISIVATSEVIGMAESPVEAVRAKRDSSITVLSELGTPKKAAKRGREPLDAIISAGNTGACISAAQMNMRRLRHVHRPGICVTVPTFSGPVVLLDVGANIEPKPTHLAQYGVMGSLFASKMLDIKKPRVGLMNVGGEEQKGTPQMKQARDMLRANESINFVGYVEGRGVFDGDADVVITDGVVGNVMLKLAEGLSSGIFRAISREVQRIDPELAQRFAPVVKEIYAQHDYHEYGGAPLLGVNGICLISHGSSEARTIANAVRSAKQFAQVRLNESISEQLGMMEEAIA